MLLNDEGVTAMKDGGFVPVPLTNVTITDDFWSSYTDLVRNTVIPYQWEALNDRIPGAEPSYAIRNFEIAAGVRQGEFGGMVFQDSDLAKWLEAVGYSLATHPDKDLEAIADWTIDLIVSAQQDDGYINTYFTIKEPDKRWTNLQECHELYCAGHMMEAAVAYYEATGKRKLLDAMCRFADYIDTVLGPEEGKIHGYPGHQEIELALVKLHRVTGEEKYLRLAEYFIDERGKSPSFFEAEWKRRDGISHWSKGRTPSPDLAYNQAHLPVREQSVAVGHSVRAVYMYSAMADLARLTGDPELLAACQRLWDNVTKRQMYITGGIGSTHIGEAFSFDWDLPNDTVYAETCASVGLIFFAQRMLAIHPKSEYADVMERALYNIILASMSRDGKCYFYVNPLEVWPEASDKNPDKRHVKSERQKWFGCSCCPPNVARLLASLGQYIYTASGDTVYAHLYIGSKADVEVAGSNVAISQTSRLPRDGWARFEVNVSAPTHFRLALRVPEWSEGDVRVMVNGLAHEGTVEDGYLIVDREWLDADIVQVTFAMQPRLMQAHPNVRADAGRVSITRGPLIYCLESVDHAAPLSSLSLNPQSELRATLDDGLFGGTVVIEADGVAQNTAWGEDELYRPYAPESQPAKIRAVPYYVWGNRGTGEMTVWMDAGEVATDVRLQLRHT